MDTTKISIDKNETIREERTSFEMSKTPLVENGEKKQKSFLQKICCCCFMK